MKIHLDRVDDQPFDWRTTLTVEAQELDQPDCLAIGPVECQGRVTSTFPDYLLQASLSFAFTLRCNRCLESFEKQAAPELTLILQVEEEEPRRGEDGKDEEVELAEEELGFLRLSQPKLDLRSLMVEQIHLGLPMKPLCREDCAGLCSDCGIDLNRESCDCSAEVDPRWAALASLKS